MGNQPGWKRSRLRRLARITAVVLLLIWILPLAVRLNYWRRPIGEALEASLHRPVHTGNIHLQVLGGLGFEIANLVVEEDPAFGYEPFVRAESAQARLAFSSLWHGRMEFSSIVLSGPSFNVVRNARGEWNLAALGRDLGVAVPRQPFSATGTSGGNGSPAAAPEEELAPGVLPRVRVESGRINFKLADRKKAYRIDAFDLDLIPPSSPQQPWKFQLQGMPTRADSPLRPSSNFRAEGQLGPFGSRIEQETGVPMRVDWSAEKAMLADLLTIFAGKDLGVQGVLDLHGHLAGTTALFRVSAAAEVGDLHRWDLLPAPEASPLRAEFTGIVDLPANSFELSSLTIPLGEGTIQVQGRVRDLLDHPRPEVEAELRHVPLSSVASLAPQFTSRLDRSFAAEGTLDGRLHAEAPADGLQGTIEVSSGFLQQSESSPRLRFSAFPILLDGSKGRLGPLRAVPGEGGPVQVSVEWDAAGRMSLWHLRGERISAPALLRLAKGYGLGWTRAEVPEGELAMRLDVTAAGDAPVRIKGWSQVTGMVIEPSGMSQPLRVGTARLEFQRSQVKVQPFTAALGPVALEGIVTVKLPLASPPDSDSPAPTPAIEFDLDSPAIDLQALASALNPLPEARSFFGFGRKEPSPLTAVDQKLAALLDTVQAGGALHAALVQFHGMALENVKTSLRYHDRRLEILEFSAEHAGGTEQGTAALSFAPQPVAFSFDSRFANVDAEELTRSSERWRGTVAGKLTGVIRLESSGSTLEEIAARLTGSGQASGRELVARGAEWTAALGQSGEAETRLASFTSNFQIGEKRIRIAEMKLIPARSARTEAGKPFHPQRWLIAGEVGFDRTVDFEVSQDPEGSKSRWGGTLDEPRLLRTVTSATTARENASLPAK